MNGRLGGTGKMIILPVDQGFEHGAARSFAPNPAAYDPHYHYQLAIDAGLSAYAAPLGHARGGRRHLRGADPDDPEDELRQLADAGIGGQGPGRDRLRRRRAAARLRRDRLHDLSGLLVAGSTCSRRSRRCARRPRARGSRRSSGPIRAARTFRRPARRRSTSPPTPRRSRRFWARMSSRSSSRPTI